MKKKQTSAASKPVVKETLSKSTKKLLEFLKGADPRLTELYEVSGRLKGVFS